MRSSQIQKAFFVRSQTIKRFSLTPHKFESGVVGLPINNLLDTLNVHTCSINTMDIYPYCCLVEKRTKYRRWSECFPSSFMLSGQHLALAITVDERCGFFLDLDFNGRGSKDERMRRLLYLVCYFWHRLGHNHQTFPGRWRWLAGVTNANDVGSIDDELKGPFRSFDA